MGLGQSDVSQCEFGRAIDGLLETFPSCSQLSIGSGHVCFLQMVIALKICFQGVPIDRSRLRNLGLVWPCEPHLHLTHNLLWQLAFEPKHAARVSLIARGPNVFVRGFRGQVGR